MRALQQQQPSTLQRQTPQGRRRQKQHAANRWALSASILLTNHKTSRLGLISTCPAALSSTPCVSGFTCDLNSPHQPCPACWLQLLEDTVSRLNTQHASELESLRSQSAATEGELRSAVASLEKSNAKLDAQRQALEADVQVRGAQLGLGASACLDLLLQVQDKLLGWLLSTILPTYCCRAQPDVRLARHLVPCP